MKTHDAVTVAQAAQSLGIGSRRLFQILRQREVLSTNNIARRTYVEQGYFRNEHRSHFLRGTHIQRWYTVPLVTGRGMALLQDLIDGMGTERPVVVEKQCGLHDQRRNGRRAAEIQRLAPGE